MSLTIRQRSDLVRAAEHSHNQRPRPRMADEIIMAEYNPKPAFKHGRIALVAVVLVVLLGVML